MERNSFSEWPTLNIVRERLNKILSGAGATIVWIPSELMYEVRNAWSQRLLLLVIDEDAFTLAIPPCGGMDWDVPWMQDDFLQLVEDFLASPVEFEVDLIKRQSFATLRSRTGRQTTLRGDYWPDA